MSTDEKRSILKHHDDEAIASSQQGCVSTLSQGWVALIFTVLAGLSVTAYSVLLTLVTTGQRIIDADVWLVVVLGAFWSCVFYIILGLIIKVLSICRITSPDTCNISLRLDERPIWILAISVINTFSFSSKLHSGTPDRTPRHLQVILFSLTLPAAIVWRYLIRKKTVSRYQMCCVIAAVLGILVSAAPLFLPQKTRSTALVVRVVWPLLFAAGNISNALDFIIYEIAFDVKKPSPLLMTFWIKFLTATFALGLFWLELIPGVSFVQQPSLETLRRSMTQTWHCHWTQEGICGYLIWRLWSFHIVVAIGFLVKTGTILYVQGPIYYGLIYCTPVPLGILFWTLFRDVNGDLFWDPHFDTDILFAVIGLCLITPATGLFYFFGKDTETYEHIEEDTKSRAQ